MGFSRSTRAAALEQELRIFWKLNVLRWELFQADPLDPRLDEIRDELEVMALMTEWPRVRDACLRCLRLDDTLRQPFIRIRAGVA